MVTRTPLGLRVSQLSARHTSHSLALTIRVGRQVVGEYPPSLRRRPETRLGPRGGGDRAVQPARGPWLGPRPPGPGITPLPARPQVSSFVNSAQDTCPVRLGVGVRIKWGDGVRKPRAGCGREAKGAAGGPAVAVAGHRAPGTRPRTPPSERLSFPRAAGTLARAHPSHSVPSSWRREPRVVHLPRGPGPSLRPKFQAATFS